jgi:hypothetical protein
LIHSIRMVQTSHGAVRCSAVRLLFGCSAVRLFGCSVHGTLRTATTMPELDTVRAFARQLRAAGVEGRVVVGAWSSAPHRKSRASPPPYKMVDEGWAAQLLEPRSSATVTLGKVHQHGRYLALSLARKQGRGRSELVSVVVHLGQDAAVCALRPEQLRRLRLEQPPAPRSEGDRLWLDLSNPADHSTVRILVHQSATGNVSPVQVMYRVGIPDVLVAQALGRRGEGAGRRRDEDIAQHARRLDGERQRHAAWLLPRDRTGQRSLVHFPLHTGAHWEGPCPSASPLGWEQFVRRNAAALLQGKTQPLAAVLGTDDRTGRLLACGLGNVCRSEVIARAGARPDCPIGGAAFVDTVVPAIRSWLKDTDERIPVATWDPFDRAASDRWRRALRAYGGVGDAMGVYTSGDYGARGGGFRHFHPGRHLWWSVRSSGAPTPQQPLGDGLPGRGGGLAERWCVSGPGVHIRDPGGRQNHVGPGEFSLFKNDAHYEPLRRNESRVASLPASQRVPVVKNKIATRPRGRPWVRKHGCGSPLCFVGGWLLPRRCHLPNVGVGGGRRLALRAGQSTAPRGACGHRRRDHSKAARRLAADLKEHAIASAQPGTASSREEAHRLLTRWLLPQPTSPYAPGGHEWTVRCMSKTVVQWEPSWVPLSQAHAAIGAHPGAVLGRRRPPSDGGEEEVELVWTADAVCQDDSCAICLETFNELESGTELCVLGCQHVFCYACIDEWFREGKPDCPTCRKRFASLRRCKRRKT